MKNFDAERFLLGLFRGESDLTDMIGRETSVDVPRFEPVTGPEQFAGLIAGWREAYPFDLIEAETRNVVEAANGSVTELRLRLSEDGREFTLPFCVIVSDTDSGTLVRVYHSERLIHGERKGRRAIWQADPEQEPTPLDEFHPAVRAYMTAIASGDAANVTERLASGGALDNGVRPVEQPEELLSIFTAMVRTGGARLVRRNEFDNGDTVAVEYTSLPKLNVAPGAPRTPPGGGVGIYDYDDSGRIRRVRMYDDFDPDGLIAAGQRPTD